MLNRPDGNFDSIDVIDMPAGGAGPTLSPRWRQWMVSRAAGEARFLRCRRNSPWFLLDRLQLDLFGWFLKVFGFYGAGVRNALDIQSTEIELSFAGLPRAFDGYRILHVSDPHFDTLAGIEAALLRRLDNIDADLCVLTGDYMHRLDCPLDESIPPMRRMTAAISARDGIVATLGNHDNAGMAAPLEDLGIRVLVNESLAIKRGGDRIVLTGTDDVHWFHTDEAEKALAEAPGGFKIALVHSPEIAQVAARAGYALYLGGHTHGGQICLPGGRPVVSKLANNRAFVSGLWRCGGMIGFTNSGAGVSFLPVRFNSRSEVALIVLKRRAL